MKILFICQYYSPEPFKHGDICEELMRRGHDVTVVAGVPNYPMGEVYEGYRHGKRKDEIINGVKIHRCHTIPRKRGAVMRLLNYLSFFISSCLYVGRLDGSFDVVFVNQLSPVTMAAAGVRYKRKHGKKLVLYCLDLWPESLLCGGIKKNGAVYRAFHRISERIYKAADSLLISSSSFAEYFAGEFGIENTEYLPQYADEVPSPQSCKKEKDGFTDLVFAGNIGRAQGLETVVKAARLTEKDKRIRWHIVGDGSEYESLKSSAEGLPNVMFYGRVGTDEMPMMLKKADAMLLTLGDESVLSMTVPAKLQGYMAAGKPVIASANGEARRIIEDAACGLCCDALDAVGLAGCAAAFCDEGDRMSSNAFEYYRRNFSRDGFMQRLADILAETAQ